MQTDTVVLLEEAECQALEAFLIARIHEFNAEATGRFDARLLGASVRNEVGEVIAGFNGYTWGGYCEISHLWVSEQHRGRGLGTALLRTAETQASRRGCRRIVLATHSFQAPAFYASHDYERKYEIEGRPEGHTTIGFVKLLQSAKGA
jgi:ribosomal protein S18 acetylase RimI-like enzyme